MSRLFSIHAERERDVVLTPPTLFDLLGLEFDLDVAAALDGDFVPAADRYTIKDDGLAQPWYGRVWMNPPYSKPEPWVDRFIEHGLSRHGEGIALLPVSRSNWQIRLWQSAEGIALPDKLFSFHGHAGYAHPVHLAAFGAECVAAIGRWGTVRVIGEGQEQ